MNPRETAKRFGIPAKELLMHGEKIADEFMLDMAEVAGCKAGLRAYRCGYPRNTPAPPEWADRGWLAVAWERSFGAEYDAAAFQ